MIRRHPVFWMRSISFWLAGGLVMHCATVNAAAARLTHSLDGVWQIADGKASEDIPQIYEHTVPVPGLAKLATPPFKDVDGFISRENLFVRVRERLAPREWITNHWNGKVEQERDYFWYRKTFRAPARREVALVRINKAQFGTAVWLNGRKVGEYPGCFTASWHSLNHAIEWNAENTLVIRVGAHPGVLPETFPTGSDFEKNQWTPGIYDSVSLVFCDNPVIESVQVAPRIDSGEVIVQTRVKNHGHLPRTASLAHSIRPWKGGRVAATGEPESFSLQPGEEAVFTRTLKLPRARLWSPEDPFLYVVESRTGGDSLTTRFGMREFRFDAATRRAHLNGRPIYLRGSNITLHRFFEDPLCGNQPWNEAWVRKLLGELPRRMHWNYFRFCIGPVPDRWFDICDEVGLLVQNEFFVWTGKPEWYPGYSRTHDPAEMIRQYADWMRDHWNHPSVVVWDANNETLDPMFGGQIIPAVRPLDLSHRPWENSYNPPVHPDDPVEYHPYLMYSGRDGRLTFRMTELETMDGAPRQGALPSDTNPPIINEYGWLWLNRDGSPTVLTRNLYPQLLGPDATARERLDLYAYLLAAKTEFWRAHRHFAGVIHFVYLTGSFPGAYTADHFADVTRLKLDAAFADYVGEAFKPLGVYLNFFQPKLAAGETREFTVMLVNDHPRPLNGRLTLALETKSGRVVAQGQRPFALEALGQATERLTLTASATAGDYVLRATARARGQSSREATVSRRWVVIEPARLPAKPETP